MLPNGDQCIAFANRLCMAMQVFLICVLQTFKCTHTTMLCVCVAWTAIAFMIGCATWFYKRVYPTPIPWENPQECILYWLQSMERMTADDWNSMIKCGGFTWLITGSVAGCILPYVKYVRTTQ